MRLWIVENLADRTATEFIFFVFSTWQSFSAGGSWSSEWGRSLWLRINWSYCDPKAKIRLTSVGARAGSWRMDKNRQYSFNQTAASPVVLISPPKWVISAVIKNFICHCECSRTFGTLWGLSLNIHLTWEMVASSSISLYKIPLF